MAKKSLAERVKNDPALLRRVLKSPGLRSQLSDAQLRKADPKLYAQRVMNARLRQPITPGSTVTERDLARESQAAMQVKYNPLEAQQRQALGAEQARARDVGGPGGFYDQYLKQLAYHHEQAKQIGAATNQQLQNTQAGITGLAAADLTSLNQAATKDAAARGATPGDLAQMASNAAAVRQGLAGSYVAQQANESAAAQGFTSGLANIVGPGQKLSAQVRAQGRVRQAGEAQTETARERAADDLLYRTGRRTEEAKTVLATKIAGAEVAGKLSDAEAKKAGAYGPGGSKMNSYGFTYDEWNKMSATDKAKARLGPPKTPSTTGYGAGKTGMNKYGFTYDEWSALPKAKQEDYRDGTAKPKTGKGTGPDWVTPGQSGTAMTQLTTLKDFVGRAKTGAAFVKGHTKQKPLTEAEAKTKILTKMPGIGKLKHPALLDAAVDAVYNHGVLSAATVRALKAAGYKPSEVARTLGATTAGKVEQAEGYGRGNTYSKGAGRGD